MAGFNPTGIGLPGLYPGSGVSTPGAATSPSSHRFMRSGNPLEIAYNERQNRNQQSEDLDLERQYIQTQMLRDQMAAAQAAREREQYGFDRQRGYDSQYGSQQALAALQAQQYGSSPRHQIGGSNPVSQATYEQYVLEQERAKRAQESASRSQSRTTETRVQPNMDAIKSLLQLMPGRI